jgi:Domain of unknown function (DUF1877)
VGMLFSYISIEQSEFDQLLDDPIQAEDFLEENEDRSADIDKAWHGLHFLLTGDAIYGDLPLGFILNGGKVISGEELPTLRIFRPEEVKSIAHALLQCKWLSLRERFDPKALTEADVYPAVWETDDGVLEYLKENFEQLRRDLKVIAADNKGLLTCIG